MGRAYTLARERKENIGGAEMSLNLCECGGEVDIRFGGHGAKFYAECRECGKTVDLEAVDMPGAVQEWNNRKGKPTKNYIPEIAKMLGVEIGEEFEVLPKIAGPGYKSSRYRFSEQGLEFSNYIHCPSETGWSPTDTITGLLNGKISIIKLPFEPKYGDEFWEVYWLEASDIDVADTEWTGDSDDYLKKQCGNCFRTKNEAKAHQYEVYERLTGRKWGGRT